MQIHVFLSTGTRTVDLDELKELVRQGVVQPSTLLETGGQRGKAKNVPALKPIFAEVAAQAQASEPPQVEVPPTFPEFSTFETQQAAPPLVEEEVYAFEKNAAQPTSSAQDQSTNAQWSWSDELASPNEATQESVSPKTTAFPADAQSPQSSELKQKRQNIKTCEKKLGSLASRKQFVRAAFIVAQVIVFFYLLSVCVDPFFNRFDVAGDRNESHYGASISIIEATLVGLYDFSYFNLIFCVVALTTLYGLRVLAECALDRNILELQKEKERLLIRCQFLENAVATETSKE